tara:strand:+ start:242 stop:1039 length:798 start_codon:yes stop_codon:yes gene_type:complete
MNELAASFQEAEHVSLLAANSLGGTDYEFHGTADADTASPADQNGLRIQWQDGVPVPPEMTRARARALVAKRAMDIVGAFSGLAALAPLLLIIACIVRLTDAGPVFFRQIRTGINGTPFSVLKFRSMYQDRGDLTGVQQTTRNDHRVTPIGRFIRKTSIDELPQLWNVLVGEMSLVGPRPHVPGMLAAGMVYEDLAPHYHFRHTMRPGLTGWAQCNGLRGPTTERRKALSRVHHDIAYVQNFSILLDIRILFRTLFRELVSSNAH